MSGLEFVDAAKEKLKKYDKWESCFDNGFHSSRVSSRLNISCLSCI